MATEKKTKKTSERPDRHMVYLRATKSVRDLLDTPKVEQKTNVERVQDAIARYAVIMEATPAPKMTTAEKDILRDVVTVVVGGGELTLAKLRLIPSMIRATGIGGVSAFATRVESWGDVKLVRAIEDAEKA